jgi:hypothetical protein
LSIAINSLAIDTRPESNRLGVVAGEKEGDEMLSMRCRAARRRRVGGMGGMDMRMTRIESEGNNN